MIMTFSDNTISNGSIELPWNIQLTENVISHVKLYLSKET